MDRIETALIWLKANNPLYLNITINKSLLDKWTADNGNEFVLPELIQYAVHIDPDDDIINNDGYIVESEGYKNNLNALHPNLPDGTIVLSNILLDPEGPIGNKKDIFMDLLPMIEDDIVDENLNKPSGHRHIQFASKLKLQPLNVYMDKDYFPAGFPTLFPYGVGGHLDECAVPVSIEHWTKTLLQHHTQKYVQHKAFIFLLYNIIRVKDAGKGNNLLVQEEYWDDFQKDIKSISGLELLKAAEDMKSGRKIENPVVGRLIANVQSISSYNKDSFGRKMNMRRLIFGKMIRHGLPAFWLTLNPSDLTSPWMLELAGIRIPIELSGTAKSAIKSKLAVTNPVLVAEFFHITIQAVLQELIKSGGGDAIGILGPIVDHFGVVESILRGMLYAHCLLWLQGGHDLAQLRTRVLEDESFCKRLCTYVESVICMLIDVSAARTFKEDPKHTSAFMPDNTHLPFNE